MEDAGSIPGLTQWVKDLVLSLLWHGFEHWPGNFHMPWVGQKKLNILKAKGEGRDLAESLEFMEFPSWRRR